MINIFTLKSSSISRGASKFLAHYYKLETLALCGAVSAVLSTYLSIDRTKIGNGKYRHTCAPRQSPDQKGSLV